MSEMNKVVDKNEIENFFKTLVKGNIIWIKVSKVRPNRPKTFFAIFENYEEECGHCLIKLGPYNPQMLFLDEIAEISIASIPSLISAINHILKFSEDYR